MVADASVTRGSRLPLQSSHLVLHSCKLVVLTEFIVRRWFRFAHTNGSKVKENARRQENTEVKPPSRHHCGAESLGTLGMRKTDREERPREIVEVVRAGGEDRLAWGKSSSVARPVSDSQANGEVQRAVQPLHGLARTLKKAVKIAAGVTVDPRSPTLAWLTGRAGTPVNMCHCGAPYDGFTPYEPSENKNWNGEAVEFQHKTE